MKNTSMAAAAQNANIRNFKNNTEAIEASIHSTRWLVKKAKEAILANKDGEIIDHCVYAIGDRHYSIDVVVYVITGSGTQWGIRVRDNVTGNNTSAGFFRRDTLRFRPNQSYKYAVVCAVNRMNNWKPKTNSETVSNNSETQTKMENNNINNNNKNSELENVKNILTRVAKEVFKWTNSKEGKKTMADGNIRYRILANVAIDEHTDIYVAYRVSNDYYGVEYMFDFTLVYDEFRKQFDKIEKFIPTLTVYVDGIENVDTIAYMLIDSYHTTNERLNYPYR